ncbi:PIN domain-like protein [Zychaea mexicana]|uniref:PIN domain-like protein n=1 Tax=Zychaea mexicana TaxID=64656 RepID=UPI0022FE47D1|nr:PIN domain-like protein [Zychaea mexicana]KAI9491857.1 PIN domain-like protein [Zychaea mexicana]
MGIHGLTKLISEHAPSAIKSNEIASYFGRKVAIDASMSIYQFMIAVRQQDGQMLTNDAGETTSHLMGMFYRTVRMVENGIKPVYVFDGRPPTLKSGELAKRKARKEEAQANLEEANEVGTSEEVARYTKRTVRVTQEHNDECKRLLKLMGIPYVEAPCEAEAQCAELAKEGLVYAAASEDMDTLTFGAPTLLRHLTFSEQRKMPIDEIHLDKTLEGLDMDTKQFTDLCILLGCDYVDSIKGVGPSRAFSLIKEHKAIEEALEHLPEKLRENVPDDWKFGDARELFLKPDVRPAKTIELKWEAPDVESVVDFMVKEKGFSEDRIRKSCEKLTKNVKSATQSRMSDFFKSKPTSAPAKPKAGKRETESKAKGNDNKKRKTRK